MNTLSLRIFLAAAMFSIAAAGFSAEPAGPKTGGGTVDAKPPKEISAVQKELQAILAKVTTKMREDKKSEADLADELKAFDDLLAKHKDEKTDDVAQVLMMKARVYLSVIGDSDKGIALVKQLKKDFPDTAAGKNADKTVEQFESMQAAKKIQASLVVGSKFPDFSEKDLAGKPLSVADYKGKVVLVDFWATWCGPCVGELPNVLKTYEKHHGDGFEIVGISLDSSEQKLKDFIETKKVSWRQYFDGKGWSNKLAGKYGVNSIPATYLLDRNGMILAKDLRGDALEKAVSEALEKK